MKALITAIHEEDAWFNRKEIKVGDIVDVNVSSVRNVTAIPGYQSFSVLDSKGNRILFFAAKFEMQ